MAQIRFPTRQQPTVTKGRSGGGQFGQQAGALIGGVAGAITGGPVGAVQGTASGAGIGGTIGGIVQPGTPDTMAQQAGQSQGIQMQSGAVDRRLQEIQQNPHFQLQQAKAALPQLDPELQKEFAPTIEAALAASRKAQQVGRQS